MGLERWLPGVSGIAALKPAQIPREIGAGVSVAAVAVPIGLAYAALVGLPPVYGLYASVAPTLAYALFGPSGRYLIVGPDTVTCLILGATLANLAPHGVEARAELAAGLTLLLGVACGVAAALRLGMISNIISRPVLVGYLTGAAVLLFVGQLPALSGVPLREHRLFRELFELIRRADEIRWPTLALGLAIFAGLRFGKRYMRVVPWPAVAIVAAIALSWALDLPGRGMQVIGAIPSGLPPPQLPALSGDPQVLATGVFGLLAVSFSSGVLTARSFGVRVGASDDPNRELEGFAAANIAAGLFQGFAVTGADSRTAVALTVGGKSALTGVTAAVAVALVLTLLSAPLALLPQAALGAILASAAVDLFDAKEFAHLAKVSRAEFIIALVATAGVIWIGVLSGVFIAVGLTLLRVLQLVARPRDAVLGRTPGDDELLTLDRHPGAAALDRIVVFLFEASVLFVNAGYFQRRAIAALDASPGARWLVLDATAMTAADSATVDALSELKATLDARGVALFIGGGHGLFNDVLNRSGLADKLGRDRLYESLPAAVAAAETARDAKA
jgi:high affinity sulfate transporter 1